jgi:hypothetical protein
LVSNKPLSSNLQFPIISKIWETLQLGNLDGTMKIPILIILLASYCLFTPECSQAAHRTPETEPWNLFGGLRDRAALRNVALDGNKIALLFLIII